MHVSLCSFMSALCQHVQLDVSAGCTARGTIWVMVAAVQRRQVHNPAAAAAAPTAAAVFLVSCSASRDSNSPAG